MSVVVRFVCFTSLGLVAGESKVEVLHRFLCEVGPGEGSLPYFFMTPVTRIRWS